MPKVSVLIPVYNRENYIAEAINSILNQTFQDFEIIVVDDGSTDKTIEIIQSLKDTRIKLYQNDKNYGIPYTRNRCLELAQGEYLANLDSDDMAMPERLEKQANFLDNNIEVGVCGSAMKLYTIDNQIHNYNYPLQDAEIKVKILFNQHFMSNSGTMFRMDILKKNKIKYDLSLFVTQDFQFFLQLLPYCQFANLPDYLIFRRQTTNSVSANFKKEQVMFHQNILANFLKKRFLLIDNAQIDFHIALIFNELKNSTANLKKIKKWFNLLLFHNHKENYFAQKLILKDIGQVWFKKCHLNTKAGLMNWWIYTNTKFSKHHPPIGFRNQIQFFWDCLVKQKSTYFNKLNN